jgi:hypothetical protein
MMHHKESIPLVKKKRVFQNEQNFALANDPNGLFEPELGNGNHFKSGAQDIFVQLVYLFVQLILILIVTRGVTNGNTT